MIFLGLVTRIIPKLRRNNPGQVVDDSSARNELALSAIFRAFLCFPWR
jgi:hypothetical protein